ncbi:hypothetical protein ACB092_11G114500 [Castanea dentata]
MHELLTEQQHFHSGSDEHVISHALARWIRLDDLSFKRQNTRSVSCAFSQWIYDCMRFMAWIAFYNAKFSIYIHSTPSLCTMYTHRSDVGFQARGLKFEKKKN